MSTTVEQYEQKKNRKSRTYKSVRNHNEGASVTGGRNGGQNERDVTNAVVQAFIALGFTSSSLSAWEWPIDSFPETMTPCAPIATERKRRCFALTQNNRTIFVVTSFKYEVSLAHITSLGQEIQNIGSKKQESDILIIEQGKRPFLLELGYQDVEGNAIDRQFSTLFYKIPMVKLATNNMIEEAVLVSGPVFDKNLTNNKVMKAIEFEIAKKIWNVENLFIGDLTGVITKITTHFT